MESKIFNSKFKAIKMPEGAAAEYAKYSCNFYKGCSNGCTYCYNNRWKWGGTTLKKCFKDETHALEIFEKELKANLPELQKHGLFFSFTTDPMLPQTIALTQDAIGNAQYNSVPVKILTKCTDWVDEIIEDDKGYNDHRKDLKAFGFTLTGHDELEPNASTNAERIQAMRKLHDAGFKTWTSIEPVIDFESSKQMIYDAETVDCDLFKIGLQSGVKYDKKEVEKFVRFISKVCASKIYFKDSLLKQAGISRSELPNNCVPRDYNMFNN
jgi:DNA repair photolyase